MPNETRPRRESPTPSRLRSKATPAPTGDVADPTHPTDPTHLDALTSDRDRDGTGLAAAKSTSERGSTLRDRMARDRLERDRERPASAGPMTPRAERRPMADDGDERDRPAPGRAPRGDFGVGLDDHHHGDDSLGFAPGTNLAQQGDSLGEPGFGGEFPDDDEFGDLAIHDRYEDIKRGEIHLTELQKMTMPQLLRTAKGEGVVEYTGLKKQDLIFKILKERVKQNGLMYGEGTLEVLPDGFGFLRSPDYNYLPCPDDIYVSPSQIRRFGLKTGAIVAGQIRPPKENERYFRPPPRRGDQLRGPRQAFSEKVGFDDLTALHPMGRLPPGASQRPPTS